MFKNIDWVSLLLGGIIGAFFSWLFTYIYYRKSKTENNLQTLEKNLIDKKNHDELMEGINYIRENSLQMITVDEWDDDEEQK